MKPVPTVKGPEDLSMLPQLTGYLLMDHPVGGIAAISLPTCRETMVRPPRNGEEPAVETLSGPDAKGRIGFIDNYSLQSQHQLKVIQLDGQNEQTLFTRPGDALWDHAISQHLALSPIGGQIVFASNLQNAQMYNPPALLQEGSIELWDIEKGAGKKHTVMALDQGFSWFPDGKRLAYVALEPGNKVGKLPLAPDGFGAEFAGWSRVPAVCILDTETGNTSFLHVGWYPVVSTNGQTVLVGDFRNRWRLVQVADPRSKPVHVPGRPIALLDNGKMLYYGLPTEGTKVKFTQTNSPLSGPKPMLTIKVGDLNTGKFQTVITDIDPRAQVSFGSIPP